MKIRVISTNELEENNTWYNRCGFVSHSNSMSSMVKLRKVKIKNGNKAVCDFYGELVQLEREEDTKVLIPLGVMTDYKNIEHKNTEYFIGQLPITLSNPRKLTHREVLLCDIEYK